MFENWFELPRLDNLRNIGAQRICIIKPSALGDVVQTMPILNVLRARFPAASLSWVINSELAGLLADHPSGVTAIPFGRRAGAWGYLSLLRRLACERFDLVLDLQGLARTAGMLLACGGKQRIGFETAREGSLAFCNAVLRGTSRDVPAWKRYWRIAEGLGLREMPRDAAINDRPAEADFSDTLLRELPRPVLAIHAGAKWITKRWPAERFGTVASRFVRQYGGSVIAVGSGDERPLAESIAEVVTADVGESVRAARLRDVTGATSLRQLAAVLRRCDLVLSNDSGPMHLAAAVGTPLVGIFTCTSPTLSGPGVYSVVTNRSVNRDASAERDTVVNRSPIVSGSTLMAATAEPGTRHLRADLRADAPGGSLLRILDSGEIVNRSPSENGGRSIGFHSRDDQFGTEFGNGSLSTSHDELVSAAVWCAASYHKNCPHQGDAHLSCLNDISVERVWSAVVRRLESDSIVRRCA